MIATSSRPANVFISAPVFYPCRARLINFSSNRRGLDAQSTRSGDRRDWRRIWLDRFMHPDLGYFARQSADGRRRSHGGLALVMRFSEPRAAFKLRQSITPAPSPEQRGK